MKAGKLTYGVYVNGYCVKKCRTEAAARHEVALILRRQHQVATVRLSALNRLGWAHF